MSNDFKIDASQLRKLNLSILVAGKDYKKSQKRLLKKIGGYVLGLAKKYCPESPTRSQYASMNKGGKTSRSATSITTGALRDSIRSDVGKDYVSINVPANSQGGPYAEKMHDEKRKTWRNRGLRTKEKGSKADEKFIYRAAEDSEKKIDELIDAVANEIIKGIGI